MKLTVPTLIAAALLIAGCGSTATTPTAPIPDPVTGTAGGVRVVSAKEATRLIADRAKVIDVRSPEEFAEGHLAGALNVNVESADFRARISELERSASYVVYCRSGRRSAVAADVMGAAGFNDVADAGALDALIAAGAPTA